METPTSKVHSPGTNGSSSSTSGNHPDSPSTHAHKNDNTVSADRHGIEEAFQSFGQLVAASRRPLPTQNGDGTYNTSKKQTGLRQDLKVIQLKGKSSSRVVYSKSLR